MTAPLDEVDVPCLDGCIPALDDPGVTDAAGGSWYPDDALVFGVVVGGEARAYPKNIMEVHEMVNDTLGGRRIGDALLHPLRVGPGLLHRRGATAGSRRSSCGPRACCHAATR